MPFIQVNMLQGRTDEQKALMYEKLTQAVVEALGVPRERVRIMVNEISKKHWCIGGLTAEARGR